MKKGYAKCVALGFAAIILTFELLARIAEKIFSHNRILQDVLDVLAVLSIASAAYLLAKAYAIREQERELTHRTATIDFVRRLSQLASWRDDETGEHAERVGEYCEVIARGLGWDESRANSMRFAGMLHDIGKIAIPDKILLTVDKFAESERSIMQSHTLLGSDIFSGSSDEVLRMAREVALSHHEWWDGTGYPYGLVGEAIPIEGRIVAVADVFDALTTKRRYKEAFDFAKSLDILKSLSGTQLDPHVVKVFHENVSGVRRVYVRYASAPTLIGINRAS